MYPSVVELRVSTLLCSDLLDEFEPGPEDLRELLQNNNRNSSDEQK